MVFAARYNPAETVLETVHPFPYLTPVFDGQFHEQEVVDVPPFGEPQFLLETSTEATVAGVVVNAGIDVILLLVLYRILEHLNAVTVDVASLTKMDLAGGDS